MGFNAAQARQALRETGGNMERAVDWLFSHPDAQGDPEENQANGAQTSGTEPVIWGSENASTDFQLQSIICHKGTSIHAGHYVAFIRKQTDDHTDSSWVLFNDEKVAKAPDVEDMKSFAYVYFFRRV